MESNLSYTLISSPRTGSTLVYFIVRWYLIKKYKYRDEHLGEYFNPYHYNLMYRDVFINGEKSYKENIPTGMQDNILKNNPGFEIINEFTFKAAPHKETYVLFDNNTIKKVYDYKKLKRVDEDIETQHRISLLEADKDGKYFFKNHANPLPIEAFNYLINTHHFICVDRLNKLEQYLSFAIANHTRIWMIRKKGEKPLIEEGSLVYSKKMFDQLTNRIKYFYSRKELIDTNKQINILYEDIKALNCKFELLDLLGFTDWRDYLNPLDYYDKIPTKQADGNSLQLFKNKEEILNWFSLSPFYVSNN